MTSFPKILKILFICNVLAIIKDYDGKVNHSFPKNKKLFQLGRGAVWEGRAMYSIRHPYEDVGTWRSPFEPSTATPEVERKRGAVGIHGTPLPYRTSPRFSLFLHLPESRAVRLKFASSAKVMFFPAD